MNSNCIQAAPVSESASPRDPSSDSGIPLAPHPDAPSTSWRAPEFTPAAPGPDKVLPDLPSRSFRIQCLAEDPEDTLPFRVAETCQVQECDGFQLTSTFSHDDHIFLVFKKL